MRLDNHTVTLKILGDENNEQPKHQECHTSNGYWEQLTSGFTNARGQFGEAGGFGEYSSDEWMRDRCSTRGIVDILDTGKAKSELARCSVSSMLSPLRSYGYWDLAHVTDSTYTRTTTRNLRRYSTLPTQNGSPQRVLSFATASAKIGEELRALSRNRSALISPLNPSSFRIDNHWPSELTAFTTSANRLTHTLVRVWTQNRTYTAHACNLAS
ncbi:hypothetical protein T265_08357 [Opisthorchis viverrini]|uniref:Uncharacterized protein n=1 Tax=Opisthorchis viverrini TaxID=6198 RepID=A0A074ZKG9_OPIVI|nr:hypothetical protein T265_08357 [Opisthorchis viverrini]KER23855.1 hypothetical protein T265_08357 [Opisthorchis viverrini]